jgi:hypothetical protein
MHKTPFAGLTELEPGESIFEDGSSFTATNPSVIDHYLQLGARTHHHNGAPALSDPVTEPTVEVQSGSGALPSSTTLIIAFTLLDGLGGETLASPSVLATTPQGLEPPPEGPYTDLQNDVGTLTVGTYRYVVTLVDSAGGETPPSAITDVQRDPGEANAHIVLSGLADYITENDGTDRYRLYRAFNQDTFNLLAEGVDDVVDDNGSLECDCCTHPPDAGLNTTGSTGSVLVTVPAAAVTDAAGWRLYISDSGDLTSPSLFGPDRTLADADTPILVDSLATADGAPPDVATTVQGAAQIDPDTDLYDWHWKRPVATTNDLPTGPDDAAGDVRLVTADGSLWTYDGSTWTVFSAPAAHWMPPVNDVFNLPASSNVVGDVRLVLADYTLHAWDGAAWQPAGGGGGTSAGSAGHTILDESNTLPARSKLAFLGSGVTASDDSAGDRTVVTIPGGGGGGGTSGPLAIGESVAWVDSDGITRGRLSVERSSRSSKVFDDTFPVDGTPAPDWDNRLEVVGGHLQERSSAPLGSDVYADNTLVGGGGLTGGMDLSVDVTIDSDQWTRLGIGMYATGSGDTNVVGYEGVIDRASGQLQIKMRPTINDSWTVVAYAPVTTMPGVGDLINVALIRDGDTLQAAAYNNTTDAWIGGDSWLVTTTPSALKNVRGLPGLHFRVAAHGAWHATRYGAFQLSGFYELVAYTAGQYEYRKVVFDSSGLGDWGWPRGTPAPDYDAGNFSARLSDGEVQFRGRLTKTSGAPPVAGELMYTFDPQFFAPAAAIIPVVTGDTSGDQLGMVEFNSDNELRWHDGRSSDPAIYQPYVALDGVRS